jgi:hypothetical protein
MDARKYASTYIKADQVRDGPIQTRIINVFESEQYSRLVLELENGSQFTLNEGNTNVLINAWGCNTDDWIGQEIEFTLGTYKDWRSDQDKETVKVRAISPAKTAQNGGAPVSKPLPPSIKSVPPRQDNMDDEVPF